MQERWELDKPRAWRLIEAATVAEKTLQICNLLPARESHVIPLLKLETDVERAAVWQDVIRERDGQPVRIPWQLWRGFLLGCAARAGLLLRLLV